MFLSTYPTACLKVIWDRKSQRDLRKDDIHSATISRPSLNSLGHSGIVKNPLWCDYNTIFPLESRSPRRNIYSPLSLALSQTTHAAVLAAGRRNSRCRRRLRLQTCFVTYLSWPASLTFARVCPPSQNFLIIPSLVLTNALCMKKALAGLYDMLVHR